MYREARELRGRLIAYARQRDVAAALGITPQGVERIELAALTKVIKAFWRERLEGHA